MKYISLFTLIILFSFSACKSPSADQPQTPDMAKSMLKLRGYEVDVDSYFRAIKGDDIPSLKAFADAGLDVNSQNSSKETALIYAIQNAETKTVKILLERADINKVDGNGNSPIHFALQKKKDEIVDLLLEKGANVNIPGISGKIKNQSVLNLAAIRGRNDLIPKLIEKGADPDLADSEGTTALISACIGASADVETVKLLLEKTKNVNHTEATGVSALMYIASTDVKSSEIRKEIIKMLLEKGANKSLKDKENKTALDYAKDNKKLDAVEALK
jgi:ankyrin repeat protein